MSHPSNHIALQDGFGTPFLTPAGIASLADGREVAGTGASDDLRGEVCCSVAGIGMRVVGLDRAEIESLDDEASDFPHRVPVGRGADWSICLHRTDPGQFVPMHELMDPESFWEYFLKLRPTPRHVEIAGLDFFARLERAPARRVAAWLPEGLGAAAIRQAVLNLLRCATAFAVAEAGGLLLHSAALLRRGEAVVCPARSGAGKSTLSGRAASLGWTVLSDELNVLWAPDDREPGVEQVPFTGDLGRQVEVPGRFPVAAVLPLRRTGRDEMLVITPAELYASLLAESVFANSDPQTLPALEATAARFVRWALERGPAQALSFTPQGDLAGLEAAWTGQARAA